VDLEKSSYTLVAVGAVGVAFTSACYALSPETLALPIASARMAEAVALVDSGARVLSIGGSVGVLADLLFAGAALALLAHRRNAPAAELLGWALSAASAIVFTVVDGMFSRVLVPGPSFVLAKSVFDLLFCAGTFAFASGTVFLFWPQRRRLLGKIALAVGAVGTLSSAAALFGADPRQLVAVPVGLGVVLWGAEMVRRLMTPAAPLLAG
jgi:hypothetical protein